MRASSPHEGFVFKCSFVALILAKRVCERAILLVYPSCLLPSNGVSLRPNPSFFPKHLRSSEVKVEFVKACLAQKEHIMSFRFKKNVGATKLFANVDITF